MNKKLLNMITFCLIISVVAVGFVKVRDVFLDYNDFTGITNDVKSQFNIDIKNPIKGVKKETFWVLDQIDKEFNYWLNQ